MSEGITIGTQHRIQHLPSVLGLLKDKIEITLWSHLKVESKQTEIIEAGTRMVAAKGRAEGGAGGRQELKGTKFHAGGRGGQHCSIVG